MHEQLKIKEKEHEDLKQELSSVILENKELSKTIFNILDANQQKANIIEHNHEVTDNLKTQIQILITEKDYVSKLWQNAIKTIHKLEDNIKLFEAGYENFVPKKDHLKLKQVYEEQITQLKQQLLETKVKLEDISKQLDAKIEIKHCEIDQSLENQASALKIVKNLEAEVLQLQKKLLESANEKHKLEKLLRNKEDLIQNLKSANYDCLTRVTEAVGLVEAALQEKDAALFRERAMKEENEKLVQEMTEMIKECEVKIKKETIKITQEYEQKQKLLLEQLTHAQNGIQAKMCEIEGISKKCILLESEIERMHRGHCSIEERDINKMLILEKNMEATFQKLLLSEKQNIQLTSDKEVLKNDLQQMANIYEKDIKTKDVETSTLKTKISNLESDLNVSDRKIITLTENLLKIKEQFAKTQHEFKDELQKYKTCLQLNCDTKIEKLTTNYNSNINQLKSQLQKKNEINQKWKQEIKVVTHSLEKLVVNLKSELTVLKKENKGMQEKMQEYEDKLRRYKIFIELISKDVTKINHLALKTNIN
ncbi:sodium channel and clathrin linker 1-like isoform X2 [Anthonomus grandis grandis]|uniref:sodium channel and clathrin linker 1-like isoform X2 n=1 Tax=Anthonomus grandis grandis TaxID=2921223 RepID=UPI002165C881|nr:sodium channel and clathrin linker 1-like isoform X2 [Anthonomus grandis grandis]